MIINFLLENNYYISSTDTEYSEEHEIYTKFKKWCESKGITPMRQKVFFPKLLLINDIKKYPLSSFRDVYNIFIDNTPVEDLDPKQVERTYKAFQSNPIALPHHLQTVLDLEVMFDSTTERLSKEEQKAILVLMQKKIAVVAMGEAKTTTIEYEIKVDEKGRIYEIPVSKKVQEHLPRLDYINAFNQLGRMIDELDTVIDIGESNNEIIERYNKWIEESKPLKERLKKS
jgi:hypothetical protein